MNHDKEAQASHSSRQLPCSAPNIDIIVEAPEDQEESQTHEQEELSFDVIVNEPFHPSDSDQDIVKSFAQAADEEQRDNRELIEMKESVESEKNKETITEGKERAHSEETTKEEKEEVKNIKEEEREIEKLETSPVDLDSLMTELGILGKPKYQACKDFPYPKCKCLNKQQYERKRQHKEENLVG